MCFYRNNSGVNTFNLGSGLTVQGAWSVYEPNTNSVVNNYATLVSSGSNINAVTFNNLAGASISTAGVFSLTVSGTTFNNYGTLTAGSTGTLTVQLHQLQQQGYYRCCECQHGRLHAQWYYCF